MSALAGFGRVNELPEIVLASTSTYRRVLLDRLGLPFRCLSPRCDEESEKGQESDARRLAERLALAKAASLQADEPDAVIIGCDQLVSLHDRIFGKPGTVARAIEHLSTMAGRTHQLFTALVVVYRERIIHHTDVTTLRMRSLSQAAIERYVAADQPLDCAGSYKLESQGITLFDRIETDDHTAITGLPLLALVSILRDLGYEIP
jgi:septum formation protein